MADKEPRKRKKRKENQKRDESEEVILPQVKEKPRAERSSEERSHDISHEPSIFAKSVFFILFSLLIVAVGVIFLTLHGVQRETWEESTEAAPESGLYEGNALHSAIPEEFLPPIDAQETSQQSEIDPSSVQDGTEEDDFVDMLSSVKPSEMHPWAEHIPQEKPEEQNIFNQLYEALEEELFEDEDDDGEDDDDEIQDGSQKGEEIDSEESADYMEDSFFNVDEDDDEDAEDEADASNADGFEVIVEEVEIPTNQVLLDLEPTGTLDAPDADEPVSASHAIPDLEASVDTLASLTEATEELKAEHVQGVVDEQDSQQQVLSSVVADVLESDSLKVEQTEQTVVPGEVPVQRNEEEWSVPQELDIIEWPEDELSDGASRKEEIQSTVSQSNDVSGENSATSSAAAEDTGQSEHEPLLHELHEPKISDEALNHVSSNNQGSEDAPVDQEYVEGDETADESEDSPAQENVVENERAQETADFSLPYENAEVTNDYDFLFKEDIDEAERVLEKEPEDSDFYFWRF